VAKTSARGGTLTAQANGAKLKQLRGERKQKEIEKGAGIPSGQLTRFETGKPVGIKYLNRLAEFYHVAPVELLSEEGLRTTGELLTDLATLRGVKVDFSTNGNVIRPTEWVEECIYCHKERENVDSNLEFCPNENSPDREHKFGKVAHEVQKVA
jgi:transcriptional regulator with XRE-family HTH domain